MPKSSEEFTICQLLNIRNTPRQFCFRLNRNMPELVHCNRESLTPILPHGNEHIAEDILVKFKLDLRVVTHFDPFVIPWFVVKNTPIECLIILGLLLTTIYKQSVPISQLSAKVRLNLQI